MSRQPATRAGSARDTLASLDTIAPDTQRRVRARIPAASLEVIDHTARLGWIPFEHDKWIPWAIVEELGEAQASAYFRHFLEKYRNAPLLRTVIDGAIRVFGLSPKSVLRVTPQTWDLVFRDHCTLEWSRQGENAARVVLRDVAPEVLGWPAYALAFRAFFLGIIDIANAQGDVTCQTDTEARTITYDLRW